jgi:PTS system glucitol/sorbitol-specific IIA component
MSIIFEAMTTKIGEMVPDFAKENMLILFDETVPKELHDIAILHTSRKHFGDIVLGDILIIAGTSYRIGFVGGVANKTIQEMGHVTLKFNGEADDLPGSICVEEKPVPNVNPGSLIQIIRQN